MIHKHLKLKLLLNGAVILCLVVLLTGALPTAAQGRGGCATGRSLVVRLAGSPYDGPRDAR